MFETKSRKMWNCKYWGAEKCDSDSLWREVYWFVYDTITIIGIGFSYNREKGNEKKFLESITKIQNVLKIWRMRGITLEGKIIVFIVVFAIWKIVFLSMISKIPTEIISELERIQNFIFVAFYTKNKKWN